MAHHVQTSFNGGEISARLHARQDIDVYTISAAEITNMVPTIEGALIKRSGTRFRALAAASASWLSAFVFNATQAYVLEWSEGKLRFITNNAILESGGSPVEVAVPYSAADAPLVCTQQSKDVLYMAHADHPHAALTRTGAASFSYAALDLKGGPFKDRNTDEAVTVTTSGVTGTITITASAAIFAAGHVGARFRIEADDFGDIRAWEPNVKGFAVNDVVRSESKVYQAETVPADTLTGTWPPTHYEGSRWDGSGKEDINDKGPYGIKWRYLHDRFGIVKITEFVSATQVTATVERRLPNSVTSVATHRWSHALFSAVEGWPHLVMLWGGRLWFFKDLGVAGSVASSYRDFSEYNEDGEATEDMAIRQTLDIPDVPLWVRADRQAMIIGTTLGEFAIGKINPGEPVSGANLQVVPQGNHGSAPVWPLKAGGEIIFTQRGSRKVRAAAYDFGQDRYIANNLMLWARHMSETGVTQLAYQAEPEELLWALRADGMAVAHPYSPQQQTKGWSRALDFGADSIKSMVSVPSPDGGRDDLWMLVDRGGTLTHEQMDPFWDETTMADAADGFFVDSGLSYSGAAATVFSGLNHLAGRTVAILADGAVVPNQVVSAGGTVTLSAAATKVSIGLPYTARVALLPPPINARYENANGRLAKVHHILASVMASFGIKTGSPRAPLEQLHLRSAATDMGDAPELRTGWSDKVSVAASFTRDSRMILESAEPFPWILRATTQLFEMGNV